MAEAMSRTLVIENDSNRRLREPDRRSEYIKIMIKRKRIPKFALAQILFELIKISIVPFVDMKEQRNEVAGNLNVLEHVTDEFHLPKLIPPKIDVQIDAFLHRGNLRVYAPNIEERRRVAPPQDTSKTSVEKDAARPRICYW
jgi:hypothetical protein